VKDVNLASLKEFVKNNLFSITLGENGLKEKIKHLGMGNKNAEDIISLFSYVTTFMVVKIFFQDEFPISFAIMVLEPKLLCLYYILLLVRTTLYQLTPML